MKPTIAIAKGIILGAALIAAAMLAGCATQSFPLGPNPLDEPGYAEPTAAELHAENIKAIIRPAHPW